MAPKIEKDQVQETPKIRNQHFSQKVLVPPGMPKQDMTEAAENSERVNMVRTALRSGVGDIGEETDTEVLKYTIPYELLAGDKLSGVPSKLRYRPLDGLNSIYLTELSIDNIDQGINSILDSLCYESKREGFSHWELPTPEKVRAFINLRINSEGPIVDALSAYCPDCGSMQVILKVNLLDFDDVDLKEEYKEPFPIHAKIDGKEENLTVRLIRSGDIQKARNIIASGEEKLASLFPGEDLKEKESSILQILEYANTILDARGSRLLFEEAVDLCYKNLDVMNALTSFNDHFMYGLKLQAYHKCTNPKCPSLKESFGVNKPDPRGSLFQVSIQAALFTIQHGEEGATKYFGHCK